MRPSCHLKSRVTRLFAPQFVQAHSKNIKAPHYWPLERGIHRWPVDSTLKGPVMWKAFTKSLYTPGSAGCIYILEVTLFNPTSFTLTPAKSLICDPHEIVSVVTYSLLTFSLLISNRIKNSLSCYIDSDNAIATNFYTHRDNKNAWWKDQLYEIFVFAISLNKLL